jgi:ATP-dependent helicase HrpA
VAATGRRRLADVHRYLRAMVARLDRLPADLARDAERMESVAYLTEAWQQAMDRAPSPALAELRWLIEELRVSYFAQTLGTPQPVSEKRVLRAIDQLAG